MGWWRGLIVLAALAGLAGAAAGQLREAYDGDLITDEAEPREWRSATPEQREAAERALARFESPKLTRFAGEEEFRRYLGALLSVQRARNGWFASARRPIRFAQLEGQGEVQSDSFEPICPETDPQCAAVVESDGSESDNITVTGSRINVSNKSVSVTNGQITNNQMRNVEEGDIVKQINHYLLILQDGRIFVVDTRGGGGRRLLLTDMANVYREAPRNIWYDEMLVFGDRVLITGYSYRDDATELSVFRLDTESGRLARDGVFYISSNDYYSSSNYATRLIGDNLVIYTPFEVSDMARASFEWPVVRRWQADDDGGGPERHGRPLFDAAQIYRPVRAIDDPTVHTVSVCPLGRAGGGRGLECRTTAFVGPNSAQWYVTESDAYLWTISRDDYSYESQACDAPDFEKLQPALVYRVPVDGSAPGLAGARGVPPDQFSLHSVRGRFLALLKARPVDCNDEREEEARLAYLNIALSDFGDTLREVPQSRYSKLPGVGSHYIANRFTDRYLVYGSLGAHRRGRSEFARPPVYAVPVDSPQSARSLNVAHTVVRAEQAGNDIVLTGYRDRDGLFVTLIDLDRQPRVASWIRLDQRFESEGRSHAFNSLIEPDGSGIMGLPTISGENRSSRAPWRSSASDLSFLTVDRSGRLRRAGELEQRVDYGRRANDDDDDDKDGVPGYKCEVSCIDWYGNSRPIFTDGRVFALTGTEMIEGKLYGGQIEEVQRLNIARSAMALRNAPRAAGGSN
jgi:hypothetical protein